MDHFAVILVAAITVLEGCGGSAGASSGSRGGSSPPSCDPGGPGMTDCGDGSESCCATLTVEGGTYDRSYTYHPGVLDGEPVPPPGVVGLADPATVSDVRLDKYDVTVGRFRRFVAAWNRGTGYTPADGSGKHRHLNGGGGLVDVGDDAGVAYEPGWVASDDPRIAPTDENLSSAACSPGVAVPFTTWTPSPGGNERRPINCVTWYEAYAFCIWDGGFLPSEAEWGYAAAGGSDEREYPWGFTPPGTSNRYAIYDNYYPTGAVSSLGVANIAPVGAAAQGAGRWGQLDLAGSMWQWTLDWFEPQTGAYVGSGTDSAYLTHPSPQFSNGAEEFLRVFRGGGFGDSVLDLEPSYRLYNVPASRLVDVGFRCARSP